MLMTLAGAARTAVLAFVVCPASLPATAGGLTPRLNWVELAGQAGDTLARCGNEGPMGRSTAKGAHARGCTAEPRYVGLAAQRLASISIAQPGASLRGHGLRHHERGDVRAVRLDGPTPDLPSLDAISVDRRDTEKEVVAKSLLTLAGSLTDRTDSNSRPHHYE